MRNCFKGQYPRNVLRIFTVNASVADAPSFYQFYRRYYPDLTDPESDILPKHDSEFTPSFFNLPTFFWGGLAHLFLVGLPTGFWVGLPIGFFAR
jgi:hypothetical protein